MDVRLVRLSYITISDRTDDISSQKYFISVIVYRFTKYSIANYFSHKSFLHTVLSIFHMNGSLNSPAVFLERSDNNQYTSQSGTYCVQQLSMSYLK
jgi:hypothetical protein